MFSIHAAWLIAILSTLGTTDSQESTLVEDVIYKNAHHVSPKELQSLTGIRKGMPLDVIANRNACSKTQDYLKKKGRYWASVTLEEGEFPSDRRVVFNVVEGPIVRIRNEKFIGNWALSDDQLHKLVDEDERCYGIFINASIDDRVASLAGLYRTAGYPDAKIEWHFIESADKASVDVVYLINEGRSTNPPIAPPTSAIAQVPAKGHMRLPVADVASNLPAPTFGPSLSSGSRNRTMIRFCRPSGMDVQVFSMDPDLVRQTIFERQWIWGRDLSGFKKSTTMFGAEFWASDGDPIYVTDFHLRWVDFHYLAPSTCSLVQGQCYRAILNGFDYRLPIPIHATIEVLAQEPKNQAVLARHAISITLTEDDFMNVFKGGTVIKIVRLCDELGEDTRGDGSAFEVSTHPGWAIEGNNPIHEARQHGSALLVIRMGIGQIFSMAVAAPSAPSSCCRGRQLCFPGPSFRRD